MSNGGGVDDGGGVVFGLEKRLMSSHPLFSGVSGRGELVAERVLEPELYEPGSGELGPRDAARR